VLERSTPPSQPMDPENLEAAAVDELGDAEPAVANRSRGAAPKRVRADVAATRAAKRVTGHTIYLPDDLFERILVQSHRRKKNISDYVTGILERHVPDYRTSRVESAGDTEQGTA
jgi:hypothetical protein